jgi:WD40 repeat protein
MEKQRVFWSVDAHQGLVNSVDGAGAEGCGYGPCEIVSGGRDGCVRLWDPRQNSSVLSLEPVDK